MKRFWAVLGYLLVLSGCSVGTVAWPGSHAISSAPHKVAAPAFAPLRGIAGDGEAEYLSARDGIFYAFGGASGGEAVWISRDGSSWVRHPIERSVIDDTRDFNEVAATRAGFVAVGDLNEAGRRNQPISWTSKDGIIWTAHLGSAAGLGTVAGADVYLTDVASNGHDIVAVGARLPRQPVHESGRLPLERRRDVAPGCNSRWPARQRYAYLVPLDHVDGR